MRPRRRRPLAGPSARRGARRRRAGAAAVALALALAGCGGGEAGAPDAPPVSGAGPNGLDARAMATYDCTDWKRADTDGRLAALDGLHAVVGGPVNGSGANGHGRVLRDEDAYRLLDRICAPDHARGFLLYKVYGRAAGFAGVAP